MGNSESNPDLKQMEQEDPNQPNVVIKQTRKNNVPLVKQLFQVLNADLIYESADKLQVDLLLNSISEYTMVVYQYILETKSLRFGNQQKYHRNYYIDLKNAQISHIKQKFLLPLSNYYQFPEKYIEFMVVDVINFSKFRDSNTKHYYHLILELSDSKKQQWLYFYKIDIEQDYSCQLKLVKESLVYEGKLYEIGELFGIKNTPLNPQWNPNTVEDKECVICFSTIINTIILPCKHMCLCNVCADHILGLANKLCPLCRIEVTNYLYLEVKNKDKQVLQGKQNEDENQYLNKVIAEKKNYISLKQSTLVQQIKQVESEKQEQIQKEQKRKELLLKNNIHIDPDNQSLAILAEYMLNDISLESKQEPSIERQSKKKGIGRRNRGKKDKNSSQVPTSRQRQQEIEIQSPQEVRNFEQELQQQVYFGSLVSEESHKDEQLQQIQLSRIKFNSDHSEQQKDDPQMFQNLDFFRQNYQRSKAKIEFPQLQLIENELGNQFEDPLQQFKSIPQLSEIHQQQEVESESMEQFFDTPHNFKKQKQNQVQEQFEQQEPEFVQPSSRVVIDPESNKESAKEPAKESAKEQEPQEQQLKVERPQVEQFDLIQFDSD
ncbi:ubiquitin-protein transferase activity protein [Paramecium bursaria]